MKTTKTLFAVSVLVLQTFLLPSAVEGATAVQAWAQRYNGTAASSDFPRAMACDAGDGGVVIALETLDRYTGRDWLVIKYSNAGGPLWTNRYNGPANGDDGPAAVAVDSTGRVFVTGYSDDSGDYSDMATVAYSGAGVALWTNRFSRGPMWGDGATAVAADSSGRVFVAGHSGTFFATVAYSAAGAVLWTNYYNPYANFAEAKAVAVDGEGNVIVAGDARDSTGRLLCATVCYSAAGALRWTGLYQESSTDQATVSALATDSRGNVFVAGSTYIGSAAPDYVTIAYSNAGVPLWTNRYNGPANSYNSYDDAYGVAASPVSGNVFVTGHSRGLGTGLYDWATIAYSRAGEPLWTNRYSGPGSSDDEVSAIVVDRTGGVFVTGNSPDSTGRQGFATIKYSEAGEFLWLRDYRDPAGQSVSASIAVDGSGNVFVSGLAMGGVEANYDSIAIGYSGAGVPLWTNRYDGPANGEDAPVAVAVDAAGTVFVTGSSMGKSSSSDFLTLAVSGSGVPLWTNRFGSAGYAADYAKALAVDSLGNVIVTGMAGTNNLDYTTIAYANTGYALWTNSYNGAGNGGDSPVGLAVDESGRAFVSGNSYGSGGRPEIATLAYSTGGAALWTNHYSGAGTLTAEALAADRDGNVFVAASFMTNGAYDFLCVGYSGAGIPLWTNIYASPDNRDDYARAIAVAADGSVAVVGYSGSDSVTIVFSGRGVPLWTNRARASGGSSERLGAVAVDANGNIFSAGYSYAAGSPYDYLVLAYSAAGVPLWTNRYNGPANGDDRATAIGVDPGGNVLVSGYSARANGFYDYLTIAYSNGGVPLWTNRYDGPAAHNDKLLNRQCLAIDRSGSLIVAGVSDASLSGNETHDYAVVKYVVPPAVAGLAATGPSAWRLSCSAMPGMTYVTQFATNLTTSPWFHLRADRADADGFWSATDYTPDPQRFYRVVAP